MKASIKLVDFHSSQQRIYNSLGRRDVLRCGRRFGKTTLLETTAIRRAIEGRKIGWFTPDYKIMRPTYQSILRSIMPIVMHHSKTDALIELHNGGSIEFWTLDNEDAGRSRSYDDVIIDEASLVKKGLKDTFEQAIAPTLLDRRGNAIMAGTPKGEDPENFFYEVCTNKDLGWREFHYPTRRNPNLDSIAVANLINEYPPLVYRQEYLAEFVDWRGEAFFSLNSLLLDGQPTETPYVCDYVFVTVDTAVKTGKENDGSAAVFWAVNKHNPGVPAVTILDWEIQQIEGDLLEQWIPTLFERAKQLAAEAHAIHGSLGVWIEDKATGMVLLQQGRRRNWPVHAINSILTSVGKSERAISVSGYVFQQKIKICKMAYNKTVNYKGVTRNHLIAQVVGFRAGDKDQIDDDLLDCFTYGVAIALGNSGGI